MMRKGNLKKKNWSEKNKNELKYFCITNLKKKKEKQGFINQISISEYEKIFSNYGNLFLHLEL